MVPLTPAAFREWLEIATKITEAGQPVLDEVMVVLHRFGIEAETSALEADIAERASGKKTEAT